jgi:hypothetical protein
LVTLLKETTVVGQNNFAEWLMVDVKWLCEFATEWT